MAPSARVYRFWRVGFHGITPSANTGEGGEGNGSLNLLYLGPASS